MASMISHFGYVNNSDSDDATQASQAVRWGVNTDLSSNLKEIRCPYTQMRILLDQSFAVAYYLKFMGNRCHEMINDYIEELNNDICYRFARVCNNGKIFEDNFQKIYQTLMNLVKFNRGGNWTDVNIGLVSEFLWDGSERLGEPVFFGKEEKGYLVPFLMWMNSGVQEGYDTYTAVKGKVGIVGFRLDYRGCDRSEGRYCVYPNFMGVGLEFSAVKTPIDTMTFVPILGYMSHMNWTGVKFETCLGMIGDLCIHTDIDRFGISGTHHLAFCLNRSLFYDVSGAAYDVHEIVSRYKDKLFTGMMEFLKFCSTNRGMEAIDGNVVAKAFNILAHTKEQKDSAAYLVKRDAAASADELRAFKHCMGTCEALQLISQNPTLVAAQTSNQETGEAKDPPSGGENKPTDTGDGIEEPKEPETKEDKEPTEGDDSDKPQDDRDIGPDDTSAEEADQPSTSDAGGADGNDPSGSSTADPSSTQTVSAPEEPNTSDEKGIEFVITPPDSSTLNAVLFREEMYKFLTNVLTNPPKCMSPQDIATLTALKRFWLSSLSIETIKGIVEACIRLPKSINNSIRKSTE